MKMASDRYIMFKPAPSNGGKYSIINAILVNAIFSGVLVPIILLISDTVFTIICIIFICCLISFFCIVVYGYYSMSYAVSADRLILRWAFLKTIIPVDAITIIGMPTSHKFDGHRTKGVGIPGHLFGAIKMRIDGSYKPVKLFSTDISKMVIITDKNEKYYGVTPASPAEFISSVKQTAMDIIERAINTD